MAETRLHTRALESLKRFSPVYAATRAVYRTVRPLPKELLRAVIPPTRTFGLPRGFYSGIELARSGARAGKVILESQTPPFFADDTLVRLSRLAQDENQPWPVFWFREKEAYLSGKSLCLRDEAGRLLAEATFSQTGYRSDPAYWHFASRPKLRITGNVTSIVGCWGLGGYWHWLMDAVSRLALLPEFPADTRILVPPLRPWMAWFLREMGLEGRWLEVSARDVAVENYYFSAPSSMTGCYNPFAVHFLRDHFLAKQSSRGDKPRRFYVVREGFTRGIHNEEEVREFFRRRGWGLVAPETLPIPEQIELFAGAEAVVALHGSALTNLLWCPPGCRVLEFAPDNFLAGAFEIVARILVLPHDFMICPGDNRTHIRVDVAMLERKLTALGV
jgi:hypothetical protein